MAAPVGPVLASGSGATNPLRKGATTIAPSRTATPADRQQLSEFLIGQGQFLLPLVKLIEQSKLVIDRMIDVLGRASIDAVLEL